MQCATCRTYSCRSGHLENLSGGCPMMGNQGIYASAQEAYKFEPIKNMAINAARIESAGYGIWCRLEETMEFCARLGFKHLGLAFCIGLREEARCISGILTSKHFKVMSVACKTGAVPKEDMGISDKEKVRPGSFEAMCNPVAQAKLLNTVGTDINLVLGLCVGHDTLFIKYSEAPVTVLAVKDRVLAHNPLGIVYAWNYHRKRVEHAHDFFGIPKGENKS